MTDVTIRLLGDAAQLKEVLRDISADFAGINPTIGGVISSFTGVNQAAAKQQRIKQGD